jgi:ABC-type glycerol-3-phosphate transport system substrate-binding protein
MIVDDVQSGLQSGTVLSCFLGTQRAAAVRKSDLSSKIKSAPIHGIKEGTPAPAIVAGQSLGIGKYAQDPNAAFDFIKTFYSLITRNSG